MNLSRPPEMSSRSGATLRIALAWFVASAIAVHAPFAVAQKASSGTKATTKAQKAPKPKAVSPASPAPSSSATTAPPQKASTPVPESDKKPPQKADLKSDRSADKADTKNASKGFRFGELEIEGRLKNPQLVYFLRRVRAEFAARDLGHRSFLLELSETRKEPSF